MTSSDSQSNHRHLPSKVSLDDFDQGVVRRIIAKMYCLKKVLPTIDDIRTELKQSIGYTGSKGRLLKDLCLHTMSGESKIADGETRCSPRLDQIPPQGQGIERGRLHSRLYMMMTPRQTKQAKS